MPTTTKGLPYPSDFDQPAVPADIGALALAVDPLLTPTATIVATARATAPDGWLLCDGSNVSRATYATLFSAIGTAFGAGDGSSTFGLPNLKGRVPIGRDGAQTEFDTIGETGGSKTHTHTNPASGTSGAHTHQIDPPLTASVPDVHTHTVPVHTHAGPSHSHTGPSHTHVTNPPTTTTSSNGSHTHGSANVPSGTGAAFSVMNDVSAGSHTHTVSIGDITSSSSGTASTGLGGTGATGGPSYVAPVTSATSSDSHSHDVDIAAFTSGAESTTHSHTVGTSDASSSLSPYVVINYIIKA